MHVLQLYGFANSCGHWKQSTKPNLPSRMCSMGASSKIKASGMKSQLGEVMILSLCTVSTHASKAPNFPSSEVLFKQNMRRKRIHTVTDPNADGKLSCGSSWHADSE